MREEVRRGEAKRGVWVGEGGKRKGVKRNISVEKERRKVGDRER